MIAYAVFRPFDFFPPNAVGWTTPGPGIRFAGRGIAYTRDAVIREPRSGLGALSIELWIRDFESARNGGYKEILSFYDGRPEPPLLLGIRARRLHLFSRFERLPPGDWIEQFRPRYRFERRAAAFVAVTYGEGEKALFVDGVEVARDSLDLRPNRKIAIQGQLVLGNSPNGLRGWWGEVEGLALFDRVLGAGEILAHHEEARERGVASLLGKEGLVLLYPFAHEGGGRANSAVPGSPALEIPARFSALPETILRRPGDDPRLPLLDAADALRNVLLFLPFGFCLGLVWGRKTGRRALLRVAIVATIGAICSLTIEALQLGLPSRSGTLLDTTWNTGGTILGVLLLRFFER